MQNRTVGNQTIAHEVGISLHIECFFLLFFFNIVKKISDLETLEQFKALFYPFLRKANRLTVFNGLADGVTYAQEKGTGDTLGAEGMGL